jgi:hypothetical protein
MEFTNEQMVETLTSLIDETLEEIEEIKKSKFAATECSLGDSEGLAGKDKNGKLEAKKKEDEDEDDEDEDKDMDKAEDCEKGENEKADSDHGKFAQAPTVSKGENEKADSDHGKFAQAPTVSKKEDKDEDEDEKEDMKKSLDAALESQEELFKSYVDSKIGSLEEQIANVAAALEAIADAPVERRGVPAGVAPLHKSTEEVEPLNKSEVANKLFELKKSGEEVDSTDIFMVETGNQATANQIASKYGLR